MASRKYPVSFKITNSGKFRTIDGIIPDSDKENPEKVNPKYASGQIIFVEDSGKLYLDFHNQRTCYTSSESSAEQNGMHYLGISTTDPLSEEILDNQVTIGGKLVSPMINDVVVFGKKEYLYREDSDGTVGWFELGNEDVEELSWEEDE